VYEFDLPDMRHEEIRDSGMLELYAMGLLEGPDFDLVLAAISNDPMLAADLAQIEETLFLFAQANASSPEPTIKPLIMGKIDYRERLKRGEVPQPVPVLNPDSRVIDFKQWLEHEDMQLRSELDFAQVSIISDEPEIMTAVVWLKSGAPPETHSIEYEKFLIVEGTCNLTIGKVEHSLIPGDYFSIPLHVSHHVEVTSDIPCKFILQRVKAPVGG
jgi:quercetin dioxygenase-like cupin family protein